MGNRLTYHKEIDGLRAIAVILVVLFHLKLSTFSGGFIGVDIFFVISGFLISKHILSDLEKGQFSFLEFYIRRVTRLMPALMMTILVTLLVCCVFYTPEDLLYVSKQGLAAVFSVSNFFYWFEAGYWDQASDGKVFLHTWSLAVEEQFYLVFPGFLFLIHTLFKKLGVFIIITDVPLAL